MRAKLIPIGLVFLSSGAFAAPPIRVSTVSAPAGTTAVTKAIEEITQIQGSKELAYFNQVARSLHLPEVGDVTLNLAYAPDPQSITGGQTESKHLASVTYSQTTPFDFSVVAHELGHVIHKTIGPTDDQLLFDPDNVDALSIIVEGVANLVAALSMNSPKIASGEFFDGAFNVDSFVTWPQPSGALTWGNWFEELAASPGYQTHAPKSVTSIQHLLSNPSNPMLSQLQPYLVSATFNQPMWIIGQKYGRETAAKILLSTLAAFTDFRKVENFPLALVAAAEKLNLDPQLVADLRHEFRLRGFEI